MAGSTARGVESHIKERLQCIFCSHALPTMPEHLLHWLPSLATLELSKIGWGAIAVPLLVVFLSTLTKRPNYPPGPPRDPILGNARQMAGDYIELRFTEWGKRYGACSPPVGSRAPDA